MAGMEDREFLEPFESCTLSYEQWTHPAHVKVALLYLRENSFDQALEIVRSKIQGFNV